MNIILAFSVLIIGLVLILLTTRIGRKKDKTVEQLQDALQNTDSKKLDSDKDGLSDFDEIHKYGTDPHSYDTDKDGIGDRQEILNRTDPTSQDTDRDRLTDYEEQQLGTDPNHWDTDRDGVQDDRDRN